MLTEVACRASLAGLENDNERCPKFDTAHPDCVCENCSISPHSPGLVANDETLLRVVYSPHHIDPQTGEFKNDALADAEKTGLSANRLNYTSKQQIESQIEEKLTSPRAIEKGYAYQGILPIECAPVRQLTYGDAKRRCYAVYDTALQDNSAHAEIFQVKLGRAEGKQAREQLRKLLIKSDAGFGKPRDLNDFFSVEDRQVVEPPATDPTRWRLLKTLLRHILLLIRAKIGR